MPTPLEKPITRETTCEIHNQGSTKRGPLVVTLLPSGKIEMRLKGTRQKFYADLGDVYRQAEVNTALANTGGPIPKLKRRR